MDNSKYTAIMQELKQGRVWLAVSQQEMTEFNRHHDEFGAGEQLEAYEEQNRTKISLKK